MEQIKYYSEDSHWGIFYMTVSSLSYGNLCVGYFVSTKGRIYTPTIGKQYSISGTIEYSPTWGETIVIEEAVALTELDDSDFRGQRYILSKLFTPNQVKNMYAALDNPYLMLKERNYTELSKIKGVDFKNAVKWCDKFEKTYKSHKAFLELARYSLTENMIERILQGCKNDLDMAIDLVKNNPYELINIKGIGWKTADEIALKNGMDLYCTDRIKMCIKLFLREQGENGKSYSTSEEIMNEILNRIGEEVPDLNIAQSLHELKDEDTIIWNDEKTKIGLKYYYNLEKQIAEHLIRLRDAPNQFDYTNWECIIKRKEESQGWEYTEQQIEGIKMVLENQVCCISGYGGTGKTSIIDGILEVLKEYKSVTVALAGRAASRISETTGKDSMTIHKLLGLDYRNRHSCYDHKTNPLGYQILVIDEMSMISGYLYLEILKSLASGTKVIFIGDVGQLESIGSCAVAADMLDSSWIASIFLDKIHRQAQKSAIITESIKVRTGVQIIPKDWSGEEIRGELQDMTLKCYTDKSNTYHEIVKYYKEELSHAKSILDIQIIVPCRQGVSSVYSLNTIAQEIYNPNGKSKKETSVKANGLTWILRTGDKVINKRNAYDIKNSDGTSHDIFNGNIGIVKTINNQFVGVDFAEIGYVEVPKSHISNIELGYAITCHSAQGSQFPVVIGGIDYSMYVMLNKELLYTMITRASKKLILAAQNKALRYAVTKHQIINRQTYLLDLLEELCGEQKYKF